MSQIGLVNFLWIDTKCIVSVNKSYLKPVACVCSRAGYTHNQLHIECLWELCLKPVVCVW